MHPLRSKLLNYLKRNATWIRVTGDESLTMMKWTPFWWRLPTHHGHNGFIDMKPGVIWALGATAQILWVSIPRWHPPVHLPIVSQDVLMVGCLKQQNRNEHAIQRTSSHFHKQWILPYSILLLYDWRVKLNKDFVNRYNVVFSTVVTLQAPSTWSCKDKSYISRVAMTYYEPWGNVRKNNHFDITCSFDDYLRWLSSNWCISSICEYVLIGVCFVLFCFSLLFFV